MTLQHALCLFAHPDDETVLAGGAIALLSAHGIRVHLACATRGEGGETGDPPVVADQSLLGGVRERELRCAAAQLGIDAITLLGYVDPVIGEGDALHAFDADFDTLVDQIATLIAETEADLVLSHGPDGEYGHPAHKLMFRATQAAVGKRADPDLLFYSIAASVPGTEDRLWNASRPAHYWLDILPWAAQKIAAMECHRSQHALFKRRRKLATVREALRRTESVYREWPGTNGAPPTDQFAALLQQVGAQAAP